MVKGSKGTLPEMFPIKLIPTKAQTAMTIKYTMKRTKSIDKESKIPFIFLLRSFEKDISNKARIALPNRSDTLGNVRKNVAKSAKRIARNIVLKINFLFLLTF